MTRASLLVLLAIALSTTAGCGDGGMGSMTDAARSDAGGPLDASAGDAGPTTDGGSGGGDDAGSGGGDSGSGGDASADAATRIACVPPGACDPFDRASCPGQACRPSAMGTMCSDVTSPPVAERMPCARNADCGPGLMCLDFGDGLGLLCHRMCADGSTGACATGEACIGTFGDACILACRPIPPPCDIYAQDCAASTDTCTFARNPETNEPYTGCRPAGTQLDGQPCGGMAGSCGRDLVCITISGMQACHQVCDPDVMPALCPTGQACTGLARTWDVGFCQAAPPGP